MAAYMTSAGIGARSATHSRLRTPARMDVVNRAAGTKHGSAITQGAKKADGSRAAHAGIYTIFANAKSSNQTKIALANAAALMAVIMWFFCMVLRDPSDGLGSNRLERG